MTDMSHGSRGPSHRTIEIAVAVAMALFSLIVLAGSIKAGVGWGAEGPKAGFFPFIVGLFILVSSFVNVARAHVTARTADRLFAEWGQLRQVLSVVIPTAVYVAVVPWIGLYISSMLLIGVFMKWLGKYRWPLSLAIAIGVPIAAYVTFEIWFLVPLPKGPIEDLLNL